MPILPFKDWPAELKKYPLEVKGVFTGGCVLRGDGSRFRAKAHAHESGGFLKGQGWICFLSAKRLAAQEIVLHELAHILAPGGHHDKWRAKVLEIGGTLDETPLLRSYHKKTRGGK